MPVIRHVLCPIDFSETSRRALDHAAAIAHWYEARLTVLYVYPNLPVLDVPPITLSESGREAINREIERFTAVVPRDVPLNSLIVEAPEIHREIQAQVTALDADLLVLGSHGRSGVKRLILGSVAERTLRHAPCPVLLVTPAAGDPSPTAPVRFKQIVCGVDFSKESVAAVKYAIAFGKENDADVTLVHAIETPPELMEPYVFPTVDVSEVRAAEEQACLRRLEGLIPDDARQFCRVQPLVRSGAADHVLLCVAADRHADLIVTGVRGRGAVSLAIFGTTTGRVVRAATCPVLVVHA